MMVLPNLLIVYEKDRGFYPQGTPVINGTKNKVNTSSLFLCSLYFNTTCLNPEFMA